MGHVACYPEGMNAIRGRVRGGHVETDAALPEGAEVVEGGGKVGKLGAGG